MQAFRHSGVRVFRKPDSGSAAVGLQPEPSSRSCKERQGARIFFFKLGLQARNVRTILYNILLSGTEWTGSEVRHVPGKARHAPGGCPACPRHSSGLVRQCERRSSKHERRNGHADALEPAASSQWSVVRETPGQVEGLWLRVEGPGRLFSRKLSGRGEDPGSKILTLRASCANAALHCANSVSLRGLNCKHFLKIK